MDSSDRERCVIVRCPRCGSLDAGSVGAVLVLLDLMKCGACGFEQECDDYEVKFDWNETLPTVAEANAARARGQVLPDVRFIEMWRAIDAKDQGEPRKAFERLCAAYDEPHRAYHNARHVGACLRLAADPAVRALASEPAEVEAAIWYHDAVYDTHARDNEEKSALLAETVFARAGVAAERIQRISAHVRATKDHATDTADGQLVIDIDLSILGESPEVFARFEKEIRREYAWVEPAVYVEGRSSVLRRFLERPHIYNTPLFRERYEAGARTNIAHSLSCMPEIVKRADAPESD